MVNMSAFTTMTDLTFNSTNLTDSENIVPNIISTADTVSQGYFGLTVMLGVFIIMFFISFKQDGDIRMDMVRSLMFASGFSSIIGTIMLVTGLSSSFVHLMWFLTTFILSILILFNLKRKDL